LEIGTIGVYCGFWIVIGLSPNGKSITLEKELSHNWISNEHFKRAGVEEKWRSR